MCLTASPLPLPCSATAYAIYDPKSRYLSPDKLDMAEQLKAAFPQSTYPTVGVLPDGNLFVSAKKSLYKYVRTDNWFTFKKAYRLPDRPGAPWAYPNTGQGTLLPINPPYTTVELISTGGATLDNATPDTPASDEAWKIDVSGGGGQGWRASAQVLSRGAGNAVALATAPPSAPARLPARLPHAPVPLCRWPAARSRRGRTSAPCPTAA